MEQTSRENQKTLYRSEDMAKNNPHKGKAIFLIRGRKKDPSVM